MRIVTLAPLFLVVGCSSAAVPWSSSDDAGDDIRTPTSDASLAADANVRSDAGAKPSNDGGGSVIDAGGWDLDAGYTPWTVVCGISTCDRQQNRMCCIDTQSGIKTCVFDRGGYLYHGRVKALAEGAREAGLQF